jgi:hypothetical protein
MSAGLFLENVGMVQRRLGEAATMRLRAERMLQKGKCCAEVALAMGVARQTVYTGQALPDEDAIDALRAVPERGRPAQPARLHIPLPNSKVDCLRKKSDPGTLP